MTENGIYRIKSGDNPWKVAQKAVLAEGKKPTNYAIAQKMNELARQNNCESVEDFNKKFFSSVGLEISTVANVNKPKPQGKTSEPDEQESVESSQAPERKMPSQMNSISKLKQNISDAGGTPVEISLKKLPQKQRIKVESYLNLYNGAIPTVIKDKKSGDVYVYLNTLNTSRGNSIKLQSINIKLNDAETVVTRYHRTGKIVQDIENNYDHLKDKSVLIQGPYKKQGARKVITKPLDIDIRLNSDIYKNATPEQKQSIDKFLGALESQKGQLMSDLGIDNDTYNRFAKLAVAIAMQETKLGTATSYEDWENTAVIGGVKDSVAMFNNGLKAIGINNPIKKFGLNSTSVSKGITQIKIGDWIKSPAIKKMFNKYGITSGYYTHPTEEQSAAATIIVLNELSKRIKRPEYRDGIAAANKKYYAVSKERKPEGGIESHSTKKWKLNKVTDDDAILYLYNGRAGVLRNGNATPTDNEYIANIRRNSKCVKVLENNRERNQALKEAKEFIPEDNNPTSPSRNMPRMQDDLGWGIGQVAFMPKVYSSGVKNNTEKEIEMLKETLRAKGFSINDIDNLVGKMQNGEIAFVKGITRQEISTMTEADLKLLIQHCDRLNSKLSNIKTDATKRKYASDADKDFKRAYLSSHAVQTSLSDVKKSAVKLNKASDKDIIKYPAKGFYTGAQRRCEGLLPQLRGNHVPGAGLALSSSRIRKGQYMGYKIEKDNGINTANASKIDILLAKNAADSANTLNTSGACLTGAKQTLIGSGVVSPSEMKGFNKAFELAKFLRSHPERFIEITHIQISPTMAREITAGDLSSLPAGCIVVFGNKDRADVFGHSGFTSGNGQIYADEVDNSNWDNFTSEDSKQDGKGEHGYIRVFKLNPAYFTVDESGTKIIKK